MIRFQVSDRGGVWVPLVESVDLEAVRAQEWEELIIVVAMIAETMHEQNATFWATGRLWSVSMMDIIDRAQRLTFHVLV